MDLLIDHTYNYNKCYCDNENYNCINLNNCKNKQIIIDNLPIINNIYKLDTNINDNMIEPNEFRKLLEYIIKFNKSNDDKVVYLLSYLYLLIKNIKLIESLYFFYEHFVVFAFTVLKYNILINHSYVNKFNNYFIKHFKNEGYDNVYCFKILNKWCNIFEDIINKQN